MSVRNVIKVGCLSLIGVALFVLLGLFLGQYYLGMTSYGSSAWQYQMETQTELHSEVSIADLVDFEWDRFFVLQPYDLTLPMKLEIFGAEKDLWWANDQKYLTFIYRRPGTTPFIIRTDFDKWSLRGGFPLRTSDKAAKLKVIKSKSPEFLDCIPRRGRCLFIENSKSEMPAQ